MWTDHQRTNHQQLHGEGYYGRVAVNLSLQRLEFSGAKNRRPTEMWKKWSGQMSHTSTIFSTVGPVMFYFFIFLWQRQEKIQTCTFILSCCRGCSVFFWSSQADDYFFHLLSFLCTASSMGNSSSQPQSMCLANNSSLHWNVRSPSKSESSLSLALHFRLFNLSRWVLLLKMP